MKGHSDTYTRRNTEVLASQRQELNDGGKKGEKKVHIWPCQVIHNITQL